MGRTIAEKILADAANTEPESVSPGDHLICDVDVAMAQDYAATRIAHKFNEFDLDVWDPSKIVCVMDHEAPSNSTEDANDKILIRKFVDEQEIENFYDVGRGISHEVMLEEGHGCPGELIVGRDSHTTTLGALGAAATGVGATDATYLFATGQNWFRVPDTIEIAISGEFQEHVEAKDLLLHVAGTYGTDIARYRSIEYTGEAVDKMNIDDRATLSNMAVELGAKFGFTPVDEKVFDYVDNRTDREYTPRRSDPDPDYLSTYDIDVSELSPQVATPHSVENVVDIQEVVQTDLDQVFIGTCTNGKFSDLEKAAEVLDGHAVDATTRLIVTPASREIYSRAHREGLLEVFIDAGATVTQPTCGACLGISGGVLGDGERCLAAQNRNFKGRMGSSSSEVFLSSPTTAAASAITGRITDPREV